MRGEGNRKEEGSCLSVCRLHSRVIATFTCWWTLGLVYLCSVSVLGHLQSTIPHAEQMRWPRSCRIPSKWECAIFFTILRVINYKYTQHRDTFWLFCSIACERKFLWLHSKNTFYTRKCAFGKQNSNAGCTTRFGQCIWNVSLSAIKYMANSFECLLAVGLSRSYIPLPSFITICVKQVIRNKVDIEFDCVC